MSRWFPARSICASLERLYVIVQAHPLERDRRNAQTSATGPVRCLIPRPRLMAGAKPEDVPVAD